MRSRNVGWTQYRLFLFVFLGWLVISENAIGESNKAQCVVSARLKEGTVSLGDWVAKPSPIDPSQLVWVAEQPLVLQFDVQNPNVNGGCPTDLAAFRGVVLSQITDMFPQVLPDDAAAPRNDGDRYPGIDGRGFDQNYTFSGCVPYVEPQN